MDGSILTSWLQQYNWHSYVLQSKNFISHLRKDLTSLDIPITECVCVQESRHIPRRFSVDLTDGTGIQLCPQWYINQLNRFFYANLDCSGSIKTCSKQQPSPALCHSISMNICGMCPELCRCAWRLLFVICLLYQHYQTSVVPWTFQADHSINVILKAWSVRTYMKGLPSSCPVKVLNNK